MIPDEKKTQVARALHTAFGTSDIDDISRLTRGLSSDLVLRIVVQGSPYLLRIMTRMNETYDAVRTFTCMKAAAEAGLAPRIHYANSEHGIAIIDWVETAPLSPAQALVQMPSALRALHALPPFPKTFNFVTAHKFFICRLPNAGLLPEQEVEAVFLRYAQLCEAYPRVEVDMVSCHMDLKPENILYDGRRVWLIDWMAAHRSDRYFDLAMVANFLIADENAEQTYLERYFGHPPDEYQWARFFLMRQTLHMLSAAVFLLLGSAGKPLPQNTHVPSFHDFHARIWAGEIDLSDNQLKTVYGQVHWVRLLENIRNVRFDAALKIVAERNARMPEVARLLPSPPC